MRLKLAGRDYLLYDQAGERPLASGDTVELRLAGGGAAGRWLRCRFVWSGAPDDAPVFAVALGGADFDVRRGTGRPWSLGRAAGSDAAEGILRVDGADLDALELRLPRDD